MSLKLAKHRAELDNALVSRSQTAFWLRETNSAQHIV